MNGANEAAVDAFLSGRIPWSEIARLIESAMNRYDGAVAESVEAVVRADLRGRECVATYLYDGGR
jgi:1-deoxy-D-xylulose-5-phosphate reductoisomerase